MVIKGKAEVLKQDSQKLSSSVKEALSFKMPCLFRKLATYLDTYDNNSLVQYINDDVKLTKRYILEKLQPDFNEIPGWFAYEELYDKMVEVANDNCVFVEVGAWFGKSTNHLAKKIRESKKEGIPFSPYNTSSFYTIGFSCGVAGLIILFVHNLHSLILFFNVLYFMAKHYNMFF